MTFRSLVFTNAAAIITTTLFMSCAWAQAPNEAICAVQQAVACASLSPCERALPAAVNLPALMRFEVDAGVIESRLESGDVRTSKIANSSTHGDALVLQGNDGSHPWAVRINTKTGRFTLTIAREDESFVGFGVCSAKILE